MSARVALLLDGGFVRVKLKGQLGRFPTAEDVVDLTRRIMAHDRLRGLELLRIYFYDAPPHSGRAINPLDQSVYGLDVAWLSVKRIVDVVVLVTAESDFVPAMKFSRREGLKVYLDTMGHGVWRDLRLHSDYVFNSSSGLAGNRTRRPTR